MGSRRPITVVCPDLMCFPVHPETLAPLRCSWYDPWAWSEPEPDVETISLDELHRRRIAAHPDSECPARWGDVCMCGHERLCGRRWRRGCDCAKGEA